MSLTEAVVLPGLLTEVQCQSKRLRKGTKHRGGGPEEEENMGSRRVSSTSRLPGQVHHFFLSSYIQTFSSSFLTFRYCVNFLGYSEWQGHCSLTLFERYPKIKYPRV